MNLKTIFLVAKNLFCETSDSIEKETKIQENI